MMNNTSRLAAITLRSCLRFVIPRNKFVTTLDQYSDKSYKPPSSSLNNRELEEKNNHGLLELSSNPSDGGLKAPGRMDIVTKIFDLSNLFLAGKLGKEEFISSDAYHNFFHHMQHNIDSYTDTQVINLLASLLKMRLSSDDETLKLLEHEVSFRCNRLRPNCIIKLLNFYRGMELNQNQRQLVETLSYRLHSHIQANSSITIKDLVNIIRLIRYAELPNSWIGLVNEKLLSLLLKSDTIDEAIDGIIYKQDPNHSLDYNSLCMLFIELSESKTRNTPVMKEAFKKLIALSLPEADKLSSDIIIQTLRALVELSYPNASLVDKLVSDLKRVCNLDCLSPQNGLDLLELFYRLRWHDHEILQHLILNLRSFYQTYSDKSVYAAKLIKTCAMLNHCSEELKSCYNEIIKPSCEPMLDQQGRNWLRYIWSLTCLKLSDEDHLKTIFEDKEYIAELIEQGCLSADARKLLNLSFIATTTYSITNLDIELLQKVSSLKFDRIRTLEKAYQKFKIVMSQILSSENHYDISTPFGFKVDFEVWFDESLNPVEIDQNRSLSSISLENFNSVVDSKGIHKFAIICSRFSDLLTNKPSEPVGHTNLMKLILHKLGYRTILIDQNIILGAKSIDELSVILTRQIKESF